MNSTSTPPYFRDQVTAMMEQGEFFSPKRPVWLARAPGRLDFMGGNVDYTGGMVLQLPLRESVWAAVQPNPQPVIRLLNPDAADWRWKTSLTVSVAQVASLAGIEAACSDAEGTRWCRYALGAFHLLQQRYGAFLQQGADLFLRSDLPPNRGVASSAALEIAALKAASAAAGIQFEGVALAEAGQWVENVVVRSACGIMDQAAVVLGRQNCLLPLVCQPCLPLDPISLPAGVRIWGIDSMAPRSTCSAAYENARAAAFMGYAMICRWEGLEVQTEMVAEIPRSTDARWNGYLSEISPSEFRSRYEAQLPEFLGGRDFLDRYDAHPDPFTTVYPDRTYPVRAAVRYAIEENLRVVTVKALLAELSPDRLTERLRLVGELLYQSHWAYTECGLGAAPCDELVEMARRLGFFGAKMTGGGGGGVVAVLGLADQEDILQQIVHEYAAKCGMRPKVFRDSSHGVDVSGVQRISPLSEASISGQLRATKSPATVEDLR